MPATARSPGSYGPHGGAPRPDRGGPIVDPLWPLLATMLGGVWLGWSWFLANGSWLGGERVARQRRLLALGLAVSCGLALLIAALLNVGVLELRAVKYVAIVLTAWKLGVSYVLLLWQRRELQLYEYYGGQARRGHLLAFGGIFLRGWVLGTLLPPGWWTLVLS